MVLTYNTGDSTRLLSGRSSVRRKPRLAVRLESLASQNLPPVLLSSSGPLSGQLLALTSFLVLAVALAGESARLPRRLPALPLPLPPRRHLRKRSSFLAEPADTSPLTSALEPTPRPLLLPRMVLPPRNPFPVTCANPAPPNPPPAHRLPPPPLLPAPTSLRPPPPLRNGFPGGSNNSSRASAAKQALVC